MHVLTRADYAHPAWQIQAAPLFEDVHGGVGIGAIDDPYKTLPQQDRRHAYRRFMLDPSTTPHILAIASYGLALGRTNTTFIYELFVPRELRGEGLGRTTLELIAEEALSQGKTTLALQALGDTENFYKRAGFERETRTRADDRVFMIKELANL